jgi:hypothetical protein
VPTNNQGKNNLKFIVYTENNHTPQKNNIMGKTRDLLNNIDGLILEHRLGKNELIRKYAGNLDIEKYYRNQIAVFDQKYEKKIKDLLDKHIAYLEEKDPYGRDPLWAAEAKKALFVRARQDLEKVKGSTLIEKASKICAELQMNPLVDQPRWPSLNLNNMFQFFKSIFSNKTAYLEKVMKSNLKSHHGSKPHK